MSHNFFIRLNERSLAQGPVSYKIFILKAKQVVAENIPGR